MEVSQATEPVAPGNPSAVVEPAKASVLTGASPEGTAPLATGTAPELPRPWMNGFTTEQKANADLVKRLSRFERGIPDLADAYVALEKKVDGAVLVPGEKATPEERAAYRKAIGVPDKPADYKLDKFDIPVIPPDQLKAADKSLTELAHNLDLNQKQLSGLRAWHLDQALAAVESSIKTTKLSQQQAETALKAKYTGGYDIAMAQMQRAFQRFGNPGLAERLTATGLGNDPDLVAVFVELGRLTSEAPFVDGKGGTPPASQYGKRSDVELAEALHGKSEAASP